MTSAATGVSVAGRMLVLDADTGAVHLDGREVPLSPAPRAVLHALGARPGHVVARADLLAVLPGGRASSEHAVDMAVARLRAGIGAALVETVVKRGYRLAVAHSGD